MSFVEMAAALAAIAFAILVGYLVPVLIQFRNTVAESHTLVARLNLDLPPLIAELRTVSRNLNDLAEQARGGVEHASVMLHAIGDVGESVQEIHHFVRGSSGTLLTNMAGLVAGFKAVTQVVRDRITPEGGAHNGG